MPSYTTSWRYETALKQPLEDDLLVKRRHPGTPKLSQLLESNLFSQFPCYLLFLILLYVPSFIAYCISAPTLNTQPSCTEYMCPTSFMRHANDKGTVCHEIVSFVFHPAHIVIAMKVLRHRVFLALDLMLFCDTECSALEILFLAFSLHLSLFHISINKIGWNVPWLKNLPSLVLF